MIIRKEIVAGLNERLSLNYTGQEQDWDLELADPNRITDFLNFIRDQNLSIEEKYAVMALVLSSYDDRLNYNPVSVADNEIWYSITELLNQSPEIYSDLLNYWALWNNQREEYLFAITKLVREYLTTFSAQL